MPCWTPPTRVGRAITLGHLSTLMGITVRISLTLTALPLIAAEPGYFVRTETFDRDPGWEGYGNRAVPANFPTVTQNFELIRGVCPFERGWQG